MCIEGKSLLPQSLLRQISSPRGHFSMSGDISQPLGRGMSHWHLEGRDQVHS